MGAFYRESKHLCLIHRHKHREAAKLRRQRNMAQMKEQNKTPEKELNKNNLSDAEFKTCLIPFARAWMELESTMLSEISQVVRDKYHMSSPLTGT